MQRLFQLPSPPLFSLEVLEDRSPPPEGFLRRISRLLRFPHQDEPAGQPFLYDEVDREALDAVVIAPYFFAQGPSGEEEAFVVLRSASRPPVLLRRQERSPIEESPNRGLWELPAGLVEESECTEEGLLACAIRELEEETGFVVPRTALEQLGPSSFPTPGMCAERHFFFRVRVDSTPQKSPSLDGSPLEAVGEVIAIPLTAALEAARQGRLEDAKTELGLRRLFDALEAP